MGEVVNLNRARKNKARADAKAVSVANRVAHGRTRAERDQAEAERSRLSKHLDGSQLEP